MKAQIITAICIAVFITGLMADYPCPDDQYLAGFGHCAPCQDTCEEFTKNMFGACPRSCLPDNKCHCKGRRRLFGPDGTCIDWDTCLQLMPPTFE